MPKKGSKLLNMRKLTEKDLDQAKKLIKDGYRIKEVCERFNVSKGYLYYYKIGKNDKL